MDHVLHLHLSALSDRAFRLNQWHLSNHVDRVRHFDQAYQVDRSYPSGHEDQIDLGIHGRLGLL